MTGHEWTNPATSKVVDDIHNERLRQVRAEGWSPEHDDEHSNHEMARAAACYAVGDSMPLDQTIVLRGIGVRVERVWPWSRGGWKPKDRRRDLIRAGALIVAEIERLDRAAAHAAKKRAPAVDREGTLDEDMS